MLPSMVVMANLKAGGLEFTIRVVFLPIFSDERSIFMTLFYDQESQPQPELVSAGTFIGDPGWQHSRRVIRTFEIICNIQGILPLQIGDTRYMVGPSTFLIVPPNLEHRGFRAITESLRFDWMHFNLPGLTPVRGNSDDPEADEASSILLPAYSEHLFMDRITVITNQLLDVYQMHGDQHYLNAILACVLYEVTMQAKQLLHTPSMNIHELQPVRDWIRIHALGPISLSQIADYFSYNKSYLSRKYRQKFGITISQEIERFRMEAAKSLLVETDDTVEGIGAIVGYKDDKYFMKVFKRNTGISPTRYRRTFHQRHFNSH